MYNAQLKVVPEPIEIIESGITTSTLLLNSDLEYRISLIKDGNEKSTTIGKKEEYISDSKFK